MGICDYYLFLLVRLILLTFKNICLLAWTPFDLVKLKINICPDGHFLIFLLLNFILPVFFALNILTPSSVP